jgi:hypothetical protein
MRLRVGPQFTGSERLEFARGAGETVEIYVPDKRNGSGSCEARYDLTERNNPMLWTIFVILLVLWLLGLVSSYTLGGFIHILLVIAIVVLIINLIQGRRPL